jgi:tRNA pseudouridine55 synthase
MFSALKRAGTPLYVLARAGIEVERAPRDIEILRIELLGLGADCLEAEVACTKGTYVRTLGEDIATRLGTCGHLASLRRLFVEPFDLEPMETLESIERGLEEGRRPRLLAPDAPLTALPAVVLAAEEARRISQGQAVAVSGVLPAAGLRLYGPQGAFLGLGVAREPGVVRPRRLLAQS